MLVDTLTLLKNVDDKKGINAFNVFNLEVVKAIIEVAEEKMIPVILQVSESALAYSDGKVLFSLIENYVKKLNVPLSIHLDHGRKLEVIKYAIDIGFQSIMVDGSYLPYEENIDFTKRMVSLAHRAGIPVEGEIGKIGGAEDNITEKHDSIVNPEIVIDFVKKTGVDFVAPSLGTSHGAYKFKGKQGIAYENIKKLKSELNIPIVLHGGSTLPEWLLNEGEKIGLNVKGMRGVSYEELKKAIDCGVKKINSDTDLRLAFTIGIKKSLIEKSDDINPRTHLSSGIQMMKKVISERMDKLWGNL